MTKVKKVCDRCDGRGYIPQWKDAMHQDGICFKCRGLGYIEVDVEKEEQRQKRKEQNKKLKFYKDILQPERK